MSDSNYTTNNEDAAPLPGDTLTCTVIGTIQTPYKYLEDCPNRHNKKPYERCTIHLSPDYASGINGFETGGKAVVLYWLHLAQRDMVELPVRKGVREAPLGVFTTRTPARPNPIAVQSVEIVAMRSGEMDVTGLDCLDGTSLLDLKRGR